MGCCESCFGPSDGPEYEKITKTEQETKSLLEPPSAAYQKVCIIIIFFKLLTVLSYVNYQSDGDIEFHPIPGDAQNEKNAMEFDTNSSVFEGLEVLQKFTNKSTYDTRCVVGQFR